MEYGAEGQLSLSEVGSAHHVHSSGTSGKSQAELHVRYVQHAHCA